MSVYFSPSAYASEFGGNGFFRIIDNKAPKDKIEVSDADHMHAINLPAGYTYSFSKAGVMSVKNPTPKFIIDEAKKRKLSEMQSEYVKFISSSIQYKSKGSIETMFQSDENSLNNLRSLLIGLGSNPKLLPKEFFWVAEDNSHVPFTYEDMELLGNAIALRGISAFANLQDKKSQIRDADNVSSVNSIVW